MKYNLKEIALMSDEPCVIEGRLNYKKTSNGAIREAVFKERWFRLVKNHLFYFRLSELGKFDTRNPAGVLVVENSSIQLEHGHTIPFAFSISFIDEPDKRHVLAARTQESVACWVERLRASSYEYLRSRLHLLQSQIYSISGYDPLLMVPRNEGARLWAPSVPFSTAPACTASSAGFSCHLHTNGHLFTLERSRSDFYVSAQRQCATKTAPEPPCAKVKTREGEKAGNANERHKREEIADFVRDMVRNGTEKNGSGYVTVNSLGDKEADAKLSVTDSVTDLSKEKEGFALDRSRTAVLSQNRLNPFNNPIFDSEALFTRPAPSPPVRKKLSPRLHRNNTDSLVERSRCIGNTSIMELVPTIPPRRKISPKCSDASQGDGPAGVCASSGAAKPDQAEDLIRF